VKAFYYVVLDVIRQAGTSRENLTPAMFSKSVSTQIVADGLGWGLAVEVSRLKQVPRVWIERFHPFGRTRRDSSTQ
jgi:hypothetical protein